METILFDEEMKAIEALAFITSSPIRINIVRTLYDRGSLNKKTLYGIVNEYSKDEPVGEKSYQWHLKRSIEEGILKLNDEECKLTNFGNNVVKSVREALKMLKEEK